MSRFQQLPRGISREPEMVGRRLKHRARLGSTNTRVKESLDAGQAITETEIAAELMRRHPLPEFLAAAPIIRSKFGKRGED